jgi:hypothetical protein
MVFGGVEAWGCCIRLISCFAVSGFCFFTVSIMRSLILSFAGWPGFLYFDWPSVFCV